MHDNRSRAQPRESRVIQAPAAGILPRIGKESAVHPLGLDAQHHYNVRSLPQRLIEVIADRNGPVRNADGQEGRRGDQLHGGTQNAKQPDVRSSDTRMQDVSDNRDADAVEVAPARPGAVEPAPDGERVEQGLCRMLVRAVPRVHDASVDPTAVGQHPGRPGRVVANHDRVGTHRGQRLRGVFQAFPFRNAGTFGAEVDDVCTQPFGGRFERNTGASGILEEKVDYGLAAQGRKLFDLARCHIRHVLRDIENTDRLVVREVSGAQQVPHERSSPLAVSPMLMNSSPSISVRRTLMRSLWDEGRFLPTKSGRIGSSR